MSTRSLPTPTVVYRLDVIVIELGQKKLDHSEFDTFKDFSPRVEQVRRLQHG